MEGSRLNISRVGLSKGDMKMLKRKINFINGKKKRQ